jgi:adenosyl cobinamide kinase/adenosyl cobinamide phosphate guanylyltransferase
MPAKKKVRFVHVATADDHLVATDSEGRMWERFKSEYGKRPEEWHEVERPDAPASVQDRRKTRLAKR